MSKVFQAMDKARQMRASQEPVSRPTETQPVSRPIDVEEVPAAPVPVPRVSPMLPMPPTPPMPPMNGPSGQQPNGLADVAPLDEDLIVTPQPELRMTEGQFGPPDDHLVSLMAPNSMEAEQYRLLRHKVEQMNREGQMKVLVITSPTPGDGKTITTLNLAGSLAQGVGAPVLVIDADLRRPSIAKYLRMESTGRGLSDAVLKPGRSLAELARLHSRYNLAVLPAGRSVTTPYEVMKSPAPRQVAKGGQRPIRIHPIGLASFDPVSRQSGYRKACRRLPHASERQPHATKAC